MAVLTKKNTRKLIGNGTDLNLITETQPEGGLIVHSDFVQGSDGYSVTLEVTGLPKQRLGRGWLRKVAELPDTMSWLSVAPENQRKAQDAVERAVNIDRDVAIGNSKNASPSDQTMALTNWQLNQEQLDALVNGNDIMMRVYVRIRVFADSVPALRTRIREIKKSLHGFGISLLFDEQDNEVKSLFTPPELHDGLGMPNKGIPVTMHNLAGSYHLNQTFQADPHGAYMGQTFNGGEVMFDQFYNDGRHRSSPQVLIIGAPRTSKSTVAKKMMKQNFAAGHTQWVFDKSNEYKGLVDDENGLNIDMGGGENRINLFQIYPTVTDETGSIPDEIGSFSEHVAKITTIFSVLWVDAEGRTQATAYDLAMMRELLTNFYIQQGMWDPSPRDNPQNIKIFLKSNSDYPTLETFVDFVETEIVTSRRKTHEEQLAIQNILLVFRELLQGDSADIFDGYTTIPDLRDEILVRFDTSKLASKGGEIFRAQNYAVYSLMSSYVINHGRKQRTLLSQGLIQKDEAKYFNLIQDEADEIINKENPLGIKTVTKLISQMGKNMFGSIFVFPRMSNVIPAEGEFSEAQDFFGLFRIHFITQLTSDDQVQTLRRALTSSVTTSQLRQTTTFKKGEVMLNFVGDRALFFTVSLLDYEERQFAGGI
ncbi:hypothetical protein EQG49_00240 [Periweissella cryptocerci]|uniref:Uncharacterized protein n=1 Tax=Periweissella cryptocerci TaxID=2506420 RepID=A0A4P6YQX1_9LACO|nr:hypothetical protein [Periweissella cryptocerci]QBO34983.1 hypothetical protein EQG49_00240 [Periweissella cryptocerci]